MSESSDVRCWICYQGAEAGDVATSLCKCRALSAAHPRCLARWQLQRAGHDEEHHCRFCRARLPDWRAALTGGDAAATADAAAHESSEPIVMSVAYGNQLHWLQVKLGDRGTPEAFREDVRCLLGLGPSTEFDITFECKLPGDDTPLELRGLSAFDAAVYCASLAAADVRTSSSAEAGCAAVSRSWHGSSSGSSSPGSGAGSSRTPSEAGSAAGPGWTQRDDGSLAEKLVDSLWHWLTE